MERELSLLKKYLLTEQKDNINNNNIFNNNYYETCSLCSSDICRILMYSSNQNNKPYFHENEYSQNMKLIKNNNGNINNNTITLCNVENFILNEKKENKDDKIKELEEENNRLKYELSLIKNNNFETSIIDLEESPIDKNGKIIDDKNKKKQEYFLNKGRKILLSKFSKIKFIKNLSNQIKNLNKKDSEDTQILIQLNQTIKNLNQNIITDKRNNNIENILLQRKKSNKDN